MQTAVCLCLCKALDIRSVHALRTQYADLRDQQRLIDTGLIAGALVKSALSSKLTKIGDF